jgi:hypothetical protein
MVQPAREDGRGQPFALSLLRGLASLLSHVREFARFFQHGRDLASHTHMRESTLCSHSATLPAHDDAHALDEVSRRVHAIVGRAMGMISMTQQANTSRHAQPRMLSTSGPSAFRPSQQRVRHTGCAESQNKDQINPHPVSSLVRTTDPACYPPAQPGYLPPLGASPYTWPNIFKNMKRMDYCVDNFDFLGNRIKCINVRSLSNFA